MAKVTVHAKYITQMKVTDILFQPLKKDGTFSEKGRRDYRVKIIEKYRRVSPDVPPYWVEYPSNKIIGEAYLLDNYLNNLMDEYDRKKKQYAVFFLNKNGKGVLITNSRPGKGFSARRKEKWS